MSAYTIDDILGKTVTFSVPTAIGSIIGHTFQRVVVTNVLTWDMTAYKKADVFALHRNIFRLLPSGTMPDNAKSYRYLLVQFPNGEEQVVGIPWIEWASITIVTVQKITVEILNVGPTDMDLIRQQLSAVNLKIGTMTLSDG